MVSTEDIKKKIILGLNLEDIGADDIDDNAPLFNEGLGLDSVDAIELIVVLDKEYGIKFENMNDLKNIFATPKSLTNYINQYKK